MAYLVIKIENDELVIKGNSEGLDAIGRAIIFLSQSSDITHTHITSPVFPLEKGSLKCVIERVSKGVETDKIKVKYWKFKLVVFIAVIGVLLIGLICF